MLWTPGGWDVETAKQTSSCSSQHAGLVGPSAVVAALVDQLGPKSYPARQYVYGTKVASPEPDSQHGADSVTVAVPTLRVLRCGRPFMMDEQIWLVARDDSGAKQPIEQIEVIPAAARRTRAQAHIITAQGQERLPGDREIAARPDVPRHRGTSPLHSPRAVACGKRCNSFTVGRQRQNPTRQQETPGRVRERPLDHSHPIHVRDTVVVDNCDHLGPGGFYTDVLASGEPPARLRDVRHNQAAVSCGGEYWLGPSGIALVHNDDGGRGPTSHQQGIEAAAELTWTVQRGDDYGYGRASVRIVDHARTPTLPCSHARKYRTCSRRAVWIKKGIAVQVHRSHDRSVMLAGDFAEGRTSPTRSADQWRFAPDTAIHDLRADAATAPGACLR